MDAEVPGEVAVLFKRNGTSEALEGLLLGVGSDVHGPAICRLGINYKLKKIFSIYDQIPTQCKYIYTPKHI
jgi:hypothetical protein